MADEENENLPLPQQQVEKPDTGATEGQVPAPPEVLSALVRQPGRNPDFPSLLGQMTSAKGVQLGAAFEVMARGLTEERDRARLDLEEMTADRDRWKDKFHQADKENAVLKEKLTSRWIELLGGAVFGAGLGVVFTQKPPASITDSPVGVAAIVVGLVMIAVGELVARRSRG